MSIELKICSLKMNLIIQNFYVDDVFCKNSFIVCEMPLTLDCTFGNIKSQTIE
jgi:hypothetical protein